MIKLATTVVLAAGVTASVLAATASSTGAVTTPTCRSAALRPVFGGSQGGAGTLEDTWRLRNVGAVTCKLAGFPAVRNYRADGRPMAVSITHAGTAQSVTLTPGQHASFTLRYTNPAILNCTPQPAAALTIQAPGTALPVIGSRGEQACQGRLTETALVHGG